MLLGKIREAACDNIRIHPGDVRDLFDVLPDASITKAFLLYPDPWPKKRHKKNRIVSDGLFDLLKKKLKPHGFFWFKTDSQPYMETGLEIARNKGWKVSGANDQPQLLRDASYQTIFEEVFIKQDMPIFRHVFHRPDSP